MKTDPFQLTRPLRPGHLRELRLYRALGVKRLRDLLFTRERLEGKKVRPGHIFLTESGEIEPEVVERVIALTKELSGCREVHHTMAGCTVATHCGPKTLGVLFIEE